MRAERHGFEYVRHEARSLYAALEVGTGHVEGRTVARHTSAEFLAFLDQLVAAQPRRCALHLIADNFAAHKTKAVAAWLAAHPRITLHYTPTYSSWLNQIELWFAKIERDCRARGIFTSTADLRRKLMPYIRAHNKTCRPFRWASTNPKHRIRAIGKQRNSPLVRRCERRQRWPETRVLAPPLAPPTPSGSLTDCRCPGGSHPASAKTTA